MYSVFINPSSFGGKCAYKDKYGEYNINKYGETIVISSPDQIICSHPDNLTYTGLQDENGNNVTKLYDFMTLIPTFVKEVKDNISVTLLINGEPIQAQIIYGGTLREFVESLIDKEQYNLDGTTLIDNNYNKISLDTPIYEDTVVKIQLDPIITFRVDKTFSKFDTEENELTYPASKITVPTPSVTSGYSFQYWKSSDGTIYQNGMTFSEPTVFNAYTVPNMYTVTFKNCGNNDTILNVPYQTIITKKDYPEFENINCEKTGYTFDGWHKESFTNSFKINLFLVIISILIIGYVIYYIIYKKNIKGSDLKEWKWPTPRKI